MGSINNVDVLLVIYVLLILEVWIEQIASASLQQFFHPSPNYTQNRTQNPILLTTLLWPLSLNISHLAASHITSLIMAAYDSWIRAETPCSGLNMAPPPGTPSRLMNACGPNKVVVLPHRFRWHPQRLRFLPQCQTPPTSQHTLYPTTRFFPLTTKSQ